jgi:rod shape-determining protein MreB and related proteins
MVREWKERHSFVGEPPAPVIVTAPVDGVPTELDITAEMQAACESIVPPIVETMFDLLSQVEPEFQERVRHNVILAGGGGSSATSARASSRRSNASAAAR